ncbi:antitermination protein Q [Salmonella enterica subsp. enterica serovar Choleraesuis]|nr:antitermination protein Q [Salmonella enterica subsp. enterica serovar Choleraesuis]
MRNVQQVLERWGGWAARDSNQLDWSPVAAGFKGMIASPRSRRLTCSDNDGMLVDSCVLRLRTLRQSGEYDLVIAHYVYGMPKRTLAKYLKQDEKTVRVQLQVAEGFIDGCLCMLDTRLDMDPEVEQPLVSSQPKPYRHRVTA